MSKPHRSRKASFPWHLFFAPALPILALYVANPDQFINPAMVVWPVFVAVVIALGLYLLLFAFFRDVGSTAAATTVLVFGGFSYAWIARALLPFYPRYALPAVYAALVLWTGLMWRKRGRAGELTNFLNFIAILAASTFLLQIAVNEARSPSVEVPALSTRGGLAAAEAPDVYVLILDGYGREDLLRERFGFDNDLVPALRSFGFSVAGEAVSNYPQTAQSLASSLNLDYLQTLLRTTDPRTLRRRTLAALISDNRFFEMFRASGYHARTYRSEYALLQPGRVDQRRAPWGFTDSFGFSAYEGTAAPVLLGALGLQRSWPPFEVHRRQVRWVLEDLIDEPGNDEAGPKLVFVHILAPHPPFVLNPEGTGKSTRLPAHLGDGDHWRYLARGTAESYEAGYIDNVRYLNAEVLRVVERVLKDATRPTIFYIQGDHGPGAGLRWEDADATDVRERHGILLALRVQEGAQVISLPARTTPINAFRLLANRALGLALPRLEDRSYFATWSEPFKFVDVTSRVHQAGHAARESGDR